MKDKTLLVTGIGGFTGVAATTHFLSRGVNVVGLVKDDNNKSRLIPKGVSIVKGDIRDKSCLQYCLSKYEVDYVLHLASQPIVRICYNDPYTAYETNVMGVVNLLEACRNLVKPPMKILVMTSDKAYSLAQAPYKEDMSVPLDGFDPYSASKLAQDVISTSYARTYGLPIVVVRAGNIYGPGDLNTSRLIPGSILRLLNGQKPTIYSGVAEFVREFLYIDDIVNAYDILFEKGISGEAYNVGGTQPYWIGDVIRMIRDKINPQMEIEVVHKEFNEIKEQYLDASKIRELGWKPKVELSEGLDSTISWYRSFNLKG